VQPREVVVVDRKINRPFAAHGLTIVAGQIIDDHKPAGKFLRKT
jgi:hypothetical protein